MRGKPYPAEIRTRAVQMVTDRLPTARSTWAAIEAVAAHLSLHPNTVRWWYRQAQGVTDERPLMPSEQNGEIARLRAELVEAQRLIADLVGSTHTHGKEGVIA